MAESSYQLPNEGTSGKIVRFIQLLINGQERLHEVNINATPDGTLYDARGGFNDMEIVDDQNVTTAVEAFDSYPCVSAMIIANLENTDIILIGNALVQPVQLGPGDKITIPINDTGKIYRKSVSGTQKVAVIALS